VIALGDFWEGKGESDKGEDRVGLPVSFTETDHMEQSEKLIRFCLECKGEMVQGPLQYEGKLWMFCSLDCKGAWDRRRKALSEDTWAG
jgi:hypothetical protein